MHIRTVCLLLLCAWYMFGCATSRPVPPQSVEPPPPPPTFALPDTPDAFVALPNWTGASIAPGVEAFARSCQKMEGRAGDAPVSNSAVWAGTVGEWTALCAGLQLVDGEASARRVIEALTIPVRITSPDGRARFTGYFEPTIETRRQPEGVFTAPVPGPPGDIIQSGNGPRQRLSGGRTRAYPPRAEIRVDPNLALGYAHPADVFFLQIQGSGRLLFPDGTTTRAAYHAHNGQPFRSTANWLLERGEITRGQASMQGIKAWMDRASPARVREAMNANPRFVFFEALPEGDPALGPVGAASIPLTPLGSMAVDRDLHALGVPYFISTTAPGLGGDWSGMLVSQDTGGAINGAVRGDIYFGTGPDAGSRAGTMNAPGEMWALLPTQIAVRLVGDTSVEQSVAERGFAP